MALPLKDIADAQLHGKDDATGKAAEGRASSGRQSSSSSEATMSSSEREDDAHQPAGSTPQQAGGVAAMSSEREDARQPAGSMPQQAGGGAAATPPPTQLMDRQMSSDGEQDRIPAVVFERDPSESNKDWSMMSTESVFGLQVAPSNDFTGFFLAHPELMDIATPPRSSTVTTPPRTSAVDAADAETKPTVILPPFDSIPELPENTMKGNYSFAFPNLIEDKRNFSKKAPQQEQQPEAAAPTEPAKAPPAPAQAEAQAQRQASNKSAVQGPVAGKGGLFSCFPCC